MDLYPMKLIASLKDYFWGGTKLKTRYGKKTNLSKVAESWELSCHPDGQSIIANGAFAGMTLAEWISLAGKDVLGSRAKSYMEFPLLVKLIDAEDNLSVQVHPNDVYAQCVEGGSGKTEVWYIIDAEPGAKLIYGLSRKVSKEEFRKHIERGTLLDICNQLPVHKGDVFFISAGTLHSIGKGILLCEVQQSSNTTYRVFDYERFDRDGKPRELHVDKALDVVRLEPQGSNIAHPVKVGTSADADVDMLATCDYFTIFHITVYDKCSLKVQMESFQTFTVIDNELVLQWGGREVEIKRGETIFLPAGFGCYTLVGNGELILSSQKNDLDVL